MRATKELQETAIFVGMRILIVEDIFEAMNLLRTMLHDLGITQVFTAKDGKEALDFLGEFDEEIDLIICDWNMPRMTGLELLRQVRTVDPDTPFLMVTGISDRDSVVTAKSAGVTGYIVKPYSSVQLAKKLTAVKRYIDARKMHLA
jgi:two-component system, chemotaxis family, chemotaxis protein CheY